MFGPDRMTDAGSPVQKQIMAGSGKRRVFFKGRAFPQDRSGLPSGSECDFNTVRNRLLCESADCSCRLSQPQNRDESEMQLNITKEPFSQFNHACLVCNIRKSYVHTRGGSVDFRRDFDFWGD